MDEIDRIIARLKQYPPVFCKCGKAARPGQRYCRECHAAYQREWRKAQALRGRPLAG